MGQSESLQAGPTDNDVETLFMMQSDIYETLKTPAHEFKGAVTISCHFVLKIVLQDRE